jgi:hypothetical protein
MHISKTTNEKAVELLTHLHSHYGAYETRKETSIWATLVLYIVGLISILAGGKKILMAAAQMPCIYIPLIVLASLLSCALFMYLLFQLKLKDEGAQIAEACCFLISQISSGNRRIQKSDLQPRPKKNNLVQIAGWEKLPRIVLETMISNRKVTRNKEPWTKWSKRAGILKVLICLIFWMSTVSFVLVLLSRYCG